MHMKTELLNYLTTYSVQFSLVAQSCLTLWDPMNHSMPGLPVYYQLPESTQTMYNNVQYTYIALSIARQAGSHANTNQYMYTNIVETCL